MRIRSSTEKACQTSLWLCPLVLVLAAASAAQDDSGFSADPPPMPLDDDHGDVVDPILREIAERIINGRANLNLVGDSISHTDMSAAYLATFRPVHGIRGYSVSGLMFSYPPWSAYTNAISQFSPELLALEEDRVAYDEFWFTYPDPEGHWFAHRAPHNVCRLTALADLPGDLPLREMGAGNYYDLIWADDSALTRPGTELRYRLLWYDHPDAMPFTVQGVSTVAPERGGSTAPVLIEPDRPESLTARWFELPDTVDLAPGDRDFSRPTGLQIRSAPDHLEQPGEQLVIAGARVWDHASDLGIQWGWTTTSGAQTSAFNNVSIEDWTRHLKFQQSDTYLVMLGVNDILAGDVTGGEVARRVGALLDRLRAAHDRAQEEDPSIRDPLFLVLSPCDGQNTMSGRSYSDNTQWVNLATVLGLIVGARDDAAMIDLRALVEAELGAWRDWKWEQTRDGVHPCGPYYHENGDVRWECTPYKKGAMFFAGLVWDALRDAAETVPPIDPADLCATDLTADCLIDGADLNELLANWGLITPGGPIDFNDDDVVDGEDLLILLSSWGPCP